MKANDRPSFFYSRETAEAEAEAARGQQMHVTLYDRLFAVCVCVRRVNDARAVSNDTRVAFIAAEPRG